MVKTASDKLYLQTDRKEIRTIKIHVISVAIQNIAQIGLVSKYSQFTFNMVSVNWALSSTYLVITSTLVWSKHYSVWCLVMEFRLRNKSKIKMLGLILTLITSTQFITCLLLNYCSQILHIQSYLQGF